MSPDEDNLKYLENYYIRQLLNKVSLSEIMMTSVHAVNYKDPFHVVEKKFQEYGIRHLPVVNSRCEVVGLITQRDLYKIHSPQKREDGTWIYDKEGLDRFILEHVMTKGPAVLHPQDPVAEAVLLMARHKYGCLPIVDDRNILCGIITQVDILKLAARILEEGQASKE